MRVVAVYNVSDIKEGLTMSKTSDLANKAKGGNSSTNDTSTANAREQLENFLKKRAAQSGDRELREKVAAELKDSITEAKQAYERCILSIISLIKEIDLIDDNISRMEKQLKKIEKEEE